MNHLVVSLVAQYLDLQSLGRFASTCREFREIIGSCELAWAALFENLAGSSDAKKAVEQSPDLTWKDRLRQLVSVIIPFQQAKERILFSYGIWRIVFLDRTTFIMSSDLSLVLEFQHQSNGWFRYRDGKNSWVVWSSVTKTQQPLRDAALTEFLSSFCGSSMPLFRGCSWHGDGRIYHEYQGAFLFSGVDILDDSIRVIVPHPARNCIRLPSEDPSLSTFDSTMFLFK